MIRTPEQMGNFWQNLASGRVYKKPSEEVERNIKRAILAEWTENQNNRPALAIKARPLPVDELQQLRGQINFLNNKVTELRAEKAQAGYQRPDYK